MKRRDFSPIAEQREMDLDAGIFSRLRRRREIAPVAAGFSRVLLGADGNPVEELTAGQKYWSRARGWAKVDVRSHALEYEIPFLDPSGLAGFVARVDVTVAVKDPVGAVAAGGESVEEFLRPALQNAIRKAHSDSAAPAEEANPVTVLNDLRVTADRNVEAIIGPLSRIPSWLSASVTSATVDLDEETEAHRDELMSKTREVALADADGRSGAARARNELQVRKIWMEGLASHLGDPERRALARIAADPSRETIDRVAGQFDQIEAQGRAAIIEALREAIKNKYFADDDAIYQAINALEKQYGNPQQTLGASASAKSLGPAPEQHGLVDAQSGESDEEGAPEKNAGEHQGTTEPDAEEDRPDADWSR